MENESALLLNIDSNGCKFNLSVENMLFPYSH